MVAFEGISHTAGRDAERLHYERPEDKGQYKGRYQPFEGVCNFSHSIFSRAFIGAVFSAVTHRYIRDRFCSLSRRKFGRADKDTNYADKSSSRQ